MHLTKQNDFIEMFIGHSGAITVKLYFNVSFIVFASNARRFAIAIFFFYFSLFQALILGGRPNFFSGRFKISLAHFLNTPKNDSVKIVLHVIIRDRIWHMIRFIHGNQHLQHLE